MYRDDAAINGFLYDRHAESVAIETFTEAIRIASDTIQSNPLGLPLIPSWNRAFAAIPDFASKLVAAVERDNRPFVSM